MPANNSAQLCASGLSDVIACNAKPALNDPRWFSAAMPELGSQLVGAGAEATVTSCHSGMPARRSPS
jgi:hypothetical protein